MIGSYFTLLENNLNVILITSGNKVSLVLKATQNSPAIAHRFSKFAY